MQRSLGTIDPDTVFHRREYNGSDLRWSWFFTDVLQAFSGIGADDDQPLDRLRLYIRRSDISRKTCGIHWIQRQRKYRTSLIWPNALQLRFTG